MRAGEQAGAAQLNAIGPAEEEATPASRRGRFAGMPLRRRLVLAISLVMVVTLLVGLGLTYVHARRKVEVEMNAAMVGGRHIVEREVEELDATPEGSRDLPGLVRVFNGSRHISAKLVDASGAVLYQSHLDSAETTVPSLLLRVLGGNPLVYRREVTLAPRKRGAVILETDARSEVGEVSGDAGLDLTILVTLFVLVLVAVNAILARALASFSPLNLAFERIGRGDYAARVVETGPPEFARLAGSCNDMARELGRIDAHARRLGLQLSKVQEEERADLARNLHDEISPFLFAVDVDAVAIKDSAAKTRDGAEIAARAQAIREATAHMKGEVRQLLGRLRPAVASDLGIAEAIDDLVGRARTRHPRATIRASVAIRPVDPATQTVIHHVVREALSNALQHGEPDQVDVTVADEADAIVVRVSDDGRGLAAAASKEPHRPGFGVIGMRERVEARGGRFSLSESRPGVVVEAVLPRSTPASGDDPLGLEHAGETA